MQKTPNKIKNKLVFQFFLLIIMSLSFTLSLSIYFNIKEKNLELNALLNDKVNYIGNLVVLNSHNDIISYDTENLEKILKELNQKKDLVYALFTNNKGQFLAKLFDYKQPDIYNAVQNIVKINGKADVLSIVKELNKVTHINNKIFSIIINNKLLGKFYMGVSNKHIKMLTHTSMLKQILNNTVIVVILGLILYWAFRRKILVPIAHLMEGAKRVSQGQLNTPVSVLSLDELGSLATAFNHMLADLRQTQQDHQEALINADQHNWVNESLRLLGESMQGEWTIEELSQKSLNIFAQRLHLVNAIFYYIKGSNLKPIASYAVANRQNLKAYQLGEGWVGQAAWDKQAHLLYEQDEQKICIQGGLAKDTEYCLYYLPILRGNEVSGVLELGLLHKPSNIQQQFIQQASEYIAVNLYAVEQQCQTNRALAATQEKTRLLEQKSIELQSAINAAQSATRAKSIFLANMSHELRTPLNAILGFSEMLTEDLEDLQETAMIEDISKIHSAGKHLLSVINDVLDLSKIEAGKMSLYLEPIQLDKMLNDLLSTVSPLMTANQNHLELVISEDLGDMQGDLTKVRQILLNVLGNAAKFCEKGHIRLLAKRKVCHTGDLIIFHVIDEGIGMTEEQQQNLFDSFTQADDSTTRRYGGTGLGLSISLQFAKMMGGNIAVESTLGQGSTFSISLPVYMSEKNPIDDQAQEQSHQMAMNPMRIDEHQLETTIPHILKPLKENGIILVIDDDPTIRELLDVHLTRLGYQVVTAAGGSEGLSMAKKLNPDVITLDVMMPDIDGWQVLSKIKSDPELAAIPVVMLSIIANQKKGYSLGATDYLIKPISRDRLANILEQYKNIESPNVLVIEDDKMTRSMVQQMLERIGCQVTTAENGRIALDLIEQGAKPDLILLDLMMPVMNGFTFAQQMCQIPVWRDIPIIVLTAKEMTRQERDQLNECVQTVFLKGHYQKTELLNQIHHLITESYKLG
jgi:signal transduction histidine kinase/CheY-like chemotaxis protein